MKISIKDRKLQIIENVAHINDLALIKKIEDMINESLENNSLLQYEKNNDSLVPNDNTAEQEILQKIIELSEDDFNNGRVISHDNLVKQSKDW